MQVKCPACKKLNQECDECTRCGCDLSALFKISMAARSRLAQGREALREGKANESLKLAETSWSLKQSNEAARLAFLACIMLREFEQASKWYSMASL